jgi:hypothetical protein
VSAAEILPIEDNPDDAEPTIYALRKSGIANDISHIADGQQALERPLDPAGCPAPWVRVPRAK